jgi:hypothetical protein
MSSVVKSLNELRKYISTISSIDDLFNVTIPEEFQLEIVLTPHSQQQHNNKSFNLRNYPEPAPLKISTMTTTCYLSTLVHMKPVFYLLPLLDNDRLNLTKLELSFIDDVNAKGLLMHNSLMAFIHSNNVKKHSNAYCPLQTFKKHFKKYFLKTFGSHHQYTDANFQNRYTFITQC